MKLTGMHWINEFIREEKILKYWRRKIVDRK